MTKTDPLRILDYLTHILKPITKSLPSLKKFRSTIKLTGKPLSEMLINERRQKDRANIPIIK